MTTTKSSPVPAPAATVAPSTVRTVLVVDDEESIRTLLSVMLELEGYRVLQAENGMQALAIAAQEHLDLITLDVMMPGLDGWQVAASLDEDEGLSAIPRVMVSGMPLAQLHAEPGARRASAVLAKPFDFVEFIEIVADLLAKPLDVPAPRDGEALAG